MNRKFIFLAIFLAVCVNARAIILYDGDNDANTSAPANGAPWGNVVQVYSSAGNITGSAVYLGGGYFITANHVSMNSASAISFNNGSDKHAIDAEYGTIQVSDGVDLKIFKVGGSVVEGIPSVNIGLDIVPNGTEILMIGGGLGRNPDAQYAPPLDAVPWGNSTAKMRWGENKINSVLNVSGDGYEYLSYAVVYTSGAQEESMGDFEAALTFYDSGSAFFYFVDDAWYLGGIATSVKTSGKSTYGTEEFSGLVGEGSDFAIYVLLAAYADEIRGIMTPVPEPSACAFLLGLFAFGFVRCRERK